jgi:uncharacterized membrane protein YciS (DUF1049 family)
MTTLLACLFGGLIVAWFILALCWLARLAER